MLGGWKYLFLKNPGKSSRRKGNGPQDMEIDHVGTVQSSLSSKVCQTKAVVTEVNLEHKKPVETLEGKGEISCIPHVFSSRECRTFQVFFFLDAAWLNEGRCPGGRPSVS